MARMTVIEDAAAIDLLASPTRLEIIDALEACAAPVTVAELAAQLGRPADGLYYHLRQLADAGLVEEEGAPEVRRYRTPTRAGERLRVRYHPGDTPNAKAVARAVASLLRVGSRDFTRALTDPASVVEGPQRDLWAARGTGWVEPEDLAEINRLLARIGELLHRSRGARSGKLVALSWVLAPLDAQPARRRAPRRAAKQG